MNGIKAFDLKDADEAILKKIFLLNESYAPFLGPLEKIDNLKRLLSMSIYSTYITINDEICGFMVCFDEKSSYESKNYEYFKKKHNKFFYVDRIGIAKSFKNKGLGTFLYKKIVDLNKNDNIKICAEVNVKPFNEESVNFHEKMGFKAVFEKEFSPNYAIRYYERDICTVRENHKSQ